MKTKTVLASILSTVFFLAMVLSVSAQTQLLPSSPTGFSFTGNGGDTGNVVSVTPPYGATFTQAWDVVVEHVDSYHDCKVYASTSQSVAAGDALVATVWYRRIDGQLPTGLPGNPTIQPNEANLVANFDQSSGTLNSVSIPLRGRLQWREVNIPFVAVTTGVASFHVDCAAALQEVQIGGIQLVDYGQKSVLSTTNPVDDTSAFVLSNNNYTWGSLTKNYPVSALTYFTNCDQVNVTVASGDNNYAQECNLNANLTKPVTSGDTLVAMLWMVRDAATSTNMGISGYNLTTESTSTNIPSFFPPLIVGPVVNGSWQQYYMPFKASQSYAETTSSNTAQLQIMFGAAVQKLDVAGIQVIDLGSSVPVSSLTGNQITYPGRWLNNQNWRTTAQANIAKYRMGNLNVNVLNYPSGVLTNVTVTANMVKPQFGFGSWENWGYITGNPPYTYTNANYQAVFSQYTGSLPSTNSVFNKITDGDYKWPIWEQFTNSPASLSAVMQWFQTNGITNIRGHNLVWPNYLNKSGTNYIDLPDDVPTLAAPALTNRVINHIIAEAGDCTNSQQTCGYIADWDVVNEPWTSRSIQAVLSGYATNNLGAVTPPVSAKVITSWLNEAAACDPVPYLFINDDGAELTYDRVVPESANSSVEEYDWEIMTNVINDGGALDGYGLESHFQNNNPPTPPTDPITENAIFTRFGGLTNSEGNHLLGEVTEYDPQFTDQGEQADYMADYLTLAFSQTNFGAFMLYGFWGGDFPTASGEEVPGTTNHFGNVFNSDWSISPSGEAYLGLTHGQWWTRNATAVSNASGTATINGFLGRYAVQASYGDVTKIYYVDLPSAAGATLNMQLDGDGGTTHVWVYDVANSPEIYQRLQRAAASGSVNGVEVTSTNGTSAFVPPGEAQGPQQMRLSTEAYGTVYIWVRALAPTASNQAIYANIDAPATTAVYLPISSTWKWSEPWYGVTLAPGREHAINFNCDQTGTQIDQILITDDPNFTPSY